MQSTFPECSSTEWTRAIRGVIRDTIQNRRRRDFESLRKGTQPEDGQVKRGRPTTQDSQRSLRALRAQIAAGDGSDEDGFLQSS